MSHPVLKGSHQASLAYCLPFNILDFHQLQYMLLLHCFHFHNFSPNNAGFLSVDFRVRISEVNVRVYKKKAKIALRHDYI
jgi:hypothetical protein